METSIVPSGILSREYVRKRCRSEFWRLGGSTLTSFERLELTARARDYLDLVDSDWLSSDELEVLRRLHELLMNWLDPADGAERVS